ncbi:UDP binding domain-containing protein [Streptomyces tanashiensis]|uniref:UDP binding domain-containing protein n=1 Tax=Streptomyces tanashiensis TaxID=67367 RepID=UPI003432969B
MGQELRGTVTRVSPFGAFVEVLRTALRRNPELDYADTLDDSVQGAELIVVATEWPHFREADPKALAPLVADPVLADLRNLIDADAWRMAGWTVRHRPPPHPQGPRGRRDRLTPSGYKIRRPYLPRHGLRSYKGWLPLSPAGERRDRTSLIVLGQNAACGHRRRMLLQNRRIPLYGCAGALHPAAHGRWMWLFRGGAW